MVIAWIFLLGVAKLLVLFSIYCCRACLRLMKLLDWKKPSSRKLSLQTSSNLFFSTPEGNRYGRVRAARPGASERARVYHGSDTPVTATRHKHNMSCYWELVHRLGALYRGISTSAEVYVNCRRRFSGEKS